jgi:hypothetical protein
MRPERGWTRSAAGLLSGFLALVLLGCDTTDPTPRGVVQGIVLVEGNALPGVTVELTGPLSRTATTDFSGRFLFDGVPAGAYVVSVRGVPPDAAFPATSRSAVVSEGGSVIVDFQGSFIRTASISGSVTSGGRGVGGVNVNLRGAATAATQTDGSGTFAFPGLRAGSYEVEITGIPPFLSFPSTRTTVELSTGQDHVVSFDGRSEITATAVIRSLSRRLPSGETEPVDPGNVRGEIEVTVTLDKGEDSPDSVLVLLGGEAVGKQTFRQGVGVSEPSDDPSSAPVDLVFLVNTAEFDPATGQPRVLNGERNLTVLLATREGGPEAWTASVPVVLRNLDTFTARVEGSRGPEEDLEGRRWWGGDLSVHLLPVIYSPGREVTSAVVEFRSPEVGEVARVTVLGQAPFLAIFPEEPGAPGSLAGYQTSAPAGDELRVVSSRYADGGLLPGLPIPLAAGLHVDLVPPVSATFALPRPSGSVECCLQNWVGSDFPFALGLGEVEDEGVGGARATFHVGEAGLTDEEVAERPAVVRGGQLPETTGNTAYRAVAVLADALENRRVVPLTPSDGNPLGNTRGAVFGVDRTPPTVMLDPDGAGLGARAINPPEGSQWVLVAEAGESGLGPSPARVTVRLQAPGIQGEDGCLVPGPGPCESVASTLVRSVPSSPPGYLTFRARVVDRAGNRSDPLEAQVLRDVLPPQVTPPSLPGSLEGGQIRSFAATAEDDVDLRLGQVGIRFGDGAGPILPFAAPDTLGRPFSGELVTEAGFSVRFPFVKGVESAPDGVPDGILRAAVAMVAQAVDAAGNRAEAGTSLPSPGAFLLQGFGPEARGDDGVRRWELGASAQEVCREDGECGDAVPGTLTLTGRARGVAGAFSRPFEAVHLLARVDGTHRWLGTVTAAEMAEVGTGAEGREWRWELAWTPPRDLPSGTVRLVMVGVDGEGMALLSPELTEVVVRAP